MGKKKSNIKNANAAPSCIRFFERKIGFKVVFYALIAALVVLSVCVVLFFSGPVSRVSLSGPGVAFEAEFESRIQGARQLQIEIDQTVVKIEKLMDQCSHYEDKANEALVQDKLLVVRDFRALYRECQADSQQARARLQQLSTDIQNLSTAMSQIVRKHLNH